MKKDNFYIFLLSIFMLFLTQPGCGKGKSGAEKEISDEVPLSVSVAPALQEEVERRIEITGTLAPFEEADISIEVDGRIAEVNVDLGDRVNKGDVLARIVPSEYEWKKVQAEADLATAEADYRRTQKLFDQSVVTKQQRDEAQRKLDVARAAADLARKKLADTVLRAPFDGSVGKRLVNQGEYVRSGTAAFFLVCINPLKFKGDVPERFAADVHTGDHVRAYTEASDNQSLVGTIVRVGPSVFSDTRSFPVEAEIDNSQGMVKPGSFARVSILTRTLHNVLTIPESAVVSFAGNPRVFVVQEGKARERVIEMEGKLRDKVLVTRGLAGGERVIVSGAELLADGQPVKVR